MRGRTNITQRAVPYVNGNVITAIADEQINVGDFVEYIEDSELKDFPGSSINNKTFVVDQSNNLYLTLIDNYPCLVRFDNNVMQVIASYTEKTYTNLVKYSNTVYFTNDASTLKIDVQNLTISITATYDSRQIEYCCELYENNLFAYAGNVLVVFDCSDVDNLVERSSFNYKTELVGSGSTKTVLQHDSAGVINNKLNLIVVYRERYNSYTYIYGNVYKLDFDNVTGTLSYNNEYIIVLQVTPASTSITPIGTVDKIEMYRNRFLFLYETSRSAGSVIEYKIIMVDVLLGTVEKVISLSGSGNINPAASEIENDGNFLIVDGNLAFLYNLDPLTNNLVKRDEKTLNPSVYGTAYGMLSFDKNYLIELRKDGYYKYTVFNIKNDKINTATLKDHVKQYAGNNAIGFAKTGGVAGNNVSIYVPNVQ